MRTYSAQSRSQTLAPPDHARGIRLDPNHAETYNNQDTAYNNRKKYDEAVADYAEAIRLSPNFPFAYSNWAIAYRSLGKDAEAMADEKRAKELEQFWKNAEFRNSNATQRKSCDCANTK